MGMGDKVWGFALGASIIDGVAYVPSTVPRELS